MKKRIGILGTTQIKHIIPILEKKYEVVNLQPIWDEDKSKVIKAVEFIKELSKVDVVYNVFTSPYFWKKARIAKLLNKKIVTHWIGTDVRVAVEGKTDLKKLRMIDMHLCCFESLQSQMKSIGVNTELVPIVPFNLKFDVNKMPQNHAVLIYMPEGVEDDYGFSEISRVFPKYPNLKFYIVANDDKEKFADYENVSVLGRLSLDEMEDLYDKVSIIVRIHLNDGLSMSVLEAMAKGKKVVWNCEFPMCLPGKTTEEICSSLDKLLKFEPTPDVEAHRFIEEEYSVDKILSVYENLFDKL